MKAIGSSLLVITPFLGADAAHLTPDQALRRLEGSSTRFRIPGNATYRLAYTESAASEPRLYVFNKGESGFVVTSADDALPAVLGYSDSGTFDSSDVSPEFKWWLSQYAAEASWFLQNPPQASAEVTSKKSARAARADIPELLTSKWNQGSPYNLDCPKVGSQTSVTGCVATAMAQVIRYHGYPARGSGQHSYSWNGTTLDFNYGATTFDYADMLDEYDESATAAQQQAVASLMYACGVGVEMSYSPNESGAGDMYIPYALKTYFNYDAGTRLLKRDYYSTEEWEDLVYSELAARRPVLYGGETPTGGHQFVCDGYENGYFHINWGWGGMSDGYFLLSVLNPNDQGIGSFEGGYNSNQAIVYGAIPSSGGTNWYPIYATGGLDVTSYNPENRSVNIVIKNGALFNYSPESADLSFRIKCVSESGQEYRSDDPTELSFAGASGLQIGGFGGLSVSLPSQLAPGEYKAYLGFNTPEGGWQDVPFPQSEISDFNVTVDSDGSYSLDEGVPVAKANVKVTSFAPTATVISGEPASFSLSVENSGEAAYSGDVVLKLYRNGEHTEPLTQTNINTSLGAGAMFTGTLTLTLTFADGEYDVIFYDKNDDVISEVFTFAIGVPPVKVTGISLSHTDESMDVDSTLQLVATIEPEDAADKSVTWSSSNPEIANVDANGLVTSFAPGDVIITVKSVVSEDVSANCKITVKEKVISAEGVSLDRTSATLTEGETLTLTATIDPETATDKTLTWISSDEEVATVDENGKVTAVKPGKATITVSTSNGKTASCEITVEAKVIAAEGVSLDRTSATLSEGETLTLTATIDPETVTDKTLTWSSSDENIATVDENGKVTAVKPGKATITVSTSNGKTASCEITVEAKVIAAEGVSLDRTSATLSEGETLTLTATIDPETVTDKTLTWSSSDENIATVDENGNVTAVKPGVAVITVSTSNGKTATCEITVEAKVIAAEGVSLDRTSATLTEGETLTLTATIDPETTTDKTMIWLSSNPEIATVDENGKVNAVKPGKATITVSTSNGKSASCEITVEAKVIAAEGVSLDRTSATLSEGETLTLTATIDPETVTDKTLTWISSDEEVATVDENGKVTAVKPGKATITVSTSNGKTATCEITVEAKVIAAEGVSLDRTSATLTEGETLTLTATIDPETATDKTLTWISSDENVATVEDGVVTALKAGKATITVSTSNGKTASCEITVESKVIAAEGVSLDRTSATLTEGDTLTLTATIDPETTSDKTLTWNSSDENVATVEDGVVTALKAGKVTITVSTSNGKTASCEITVEAKVIAAEGVSLDRTSATLTEGETLTLTATIDPETTSDKTLTWISSDENIATVDENGKVTAVKPGKATITVSTSNGKSASCEITVEAKVIAAEGVSLDRTSATLTEGETLTLTATIDPETVTDKTLTWSSSNPEIATVDENGKITAVKPGKATITVSTSNGKTASCEITVEAKVIAAEGVSLDRTSAILTEGETLTLTVTIDPETVTDKTLTWSSSNPEIATVDENGKVTAVKPGVAVITVSTSNGKTASCEITVEAKVIAADGVSLDRTSATLTEGETLTLTATIDPETTSDKTLTWISSDENIATVDENGKVTAVKPGKATITVSTSNGKSASCEITVEAKVIAAEGVSLDRTSATLTEGETLTLTATIDPETATDKTLTWSSSNPEIATVDENGKVTAVKPGVAVITVSTSNGKTASCEITVEAKVIAAEGVSLDLTSATLTEGETLTLTATIDPETVTDKTLTWISSDEDVATVEDGVVTALKAGVAVITVSTSNGKTASCVITVEAKEPEIIYVSSITLDRTEIAAVPGTVITLVATVLPEDATDKTILWSSSDEKVATVDASGTVTVLNVGSAVITAVSADGSEIEAECFIYGTSLIDSIENGIVSADIFTVNGILLRKNADIRYISDLAKGTYIIRIGNVVHKIVK